MFALFQFEYGGTALELLLGPRSWMGVNTAWPVPSVPLCRKPVTGTGGSLKTGAGEHKVDALFGREGVLDYSGDIGVAGMHRMGIEKYIL